MASRLAHHSGGPGVGRVGADVPNRRSTFGGEVAAQVTPARVTGGPARRAVSHRGEWEMPVIPTRRDCPRGYEGVGGRSPGSAAMGLPPGNASVLLTKREAGAWSCNFVCTLPSSRVNSADADSPWPLQKKPESDQAPLDRFRPSSGPPCGPQSGRATTNGALGAAVDSEGYAPRHHSAPSCPRWPTGYIVATAERMTS